MKDIGDGVNLRQPAQSRLDFLGHVKSHSSIINDPGRLRRMKEKAQLAPSGDFKRSRQLKRKEETKDMENLALLLCEGVRMYRSGETGERAFKKDHIRAILVLSFNYSEKSKKKK